MKIVFGILIILLILLGLFFCYQAFFLKTPDQNQPSPLASLSALFTHPALSYSFEYPAGWQTQVQAIPPGAKQKYEDVSIRSQDYKISEGYPIMESGAEFWLNAKETSEVDINKEFENGPGLVRQLAQNKTSVTVDGQPAIQYSYSYEGTMAAQTVFIKNGLYYTLRFRYPNEATKNLYWPNYLNFLNSFRVK